MPPMQVQAPAVPYTQTVPLQAPTGQPDLEDEEEHNQ